MNYFKYLFGEESNSKPVEDKAPIRDAYIIFCNDGDRNIPRLINAIKKHGNGGHSFGIVVDEGATDAETIGWDGDGSDRIDSIIKIQIDGKDGKDALINMLLYTLNGIKWQAEEGTISDEEAVELEEPPVTRERMREIFNNILHDVALCLNGCGFEDVNMRAITTIKEYCENTMEAMQGGYLRKDASLEESLSHIKRIAEEALKESKKK